MNTLIKSLITLSLLTVSAFTMANTQEQNMPTYEFNYVENINIVKQQTQQVLQTMQYNLVLDINSQAIHGIESSIVNLPSNSELYANSDVTNNNNLLSE